MISLTVILGAAVPVLIGLAVGLMVASDKTKFERPSYVLGGLLIGLASMSFVSAFFSLNHNIAESERACFDKGGIIYERACVADAPVRIHKL